MGGHLPGENGKKTFFCEDIWKGDIPIRSQFPELYQMCSHPRASVVDHWDGDDWHIPFSRSLTSSERDCLDDLLSGLRQFNLEDGKDSVFWALDKSKSFSTNSLYSFMTNRGVTLKPSGNFWDARVESCWSGEGQGVSGAPQVLGEGFRPSISSTIDIGFIWVVSFLPRLWAVALVLHVNWYPQCVSWLAVNT